MAVAPSYKPIRLPTLTQGQPFVDERGRLTNDALRQLNRIFGELTNFSNAIGVLPLIQEALADFAIRADNLDAATQAALDAAEASTAATANASREQSLVNSYIQPDSVLSASPTTITVASHTRYYADGTNVAVTGGTVAASAPTSTSYVSYLDSTRAGGAVTYTVSTTQPIQTGDTHVVGAVRIPEAGTADGGGGPRPPGYVIPREPETVEP